MREMLSSSTVARQLQRIEPVEASPAKPHLNEVEAWKQQVGQAIDYAISQANRTQKEVWAALGHPDGAQLNRWIKATENAQLGPLLAIAWLRQPLAIALAQLAGAEVETVIRVRRSL